MNRFIVSLFMVSFSAALMGQSESQLSDYLKRHPAADADGDGKLTRQEARAHRRNDPSRGDNVASVSHIAGVDIPRSEAPVEVVSMTSADGVDLSFAWRKPEGVGPFPVLVFFHGGGGQSPLSRLKSNLLTGAVQTRFLAKGYATVQSTRRPFWKTDRGPSGFYDAVSDATKVVEKVKTLPGVDSDRVILYGGSGGGILAIVTAAKSDVACVIAGEPATVVPLDPRTGQSAGPGDYRDLMDDPWQRYTEGRRREMRAWMKQIRAPILVLQGEKVGLYRTNFEILIPEMKKLGRDISSIVYPGLTHGFYWGTVRTGATVETVEKVVGDVDAFIEDRLEETTK